MLQKYKPYFSSDVPSPSPQPTKSRVYRRIWKRKRSPGELQRRRQRQFDYQNTSTPCMPEPESKLESGSWEGGSVTWDWNSSDLGDRCFWGGGYSWGTPQGERGFVERSSNLNNSTVLSPPPPQNWWQPPCWVVGHGHLHHILAPLLRPVSQHHQFNVMGVTVGAISMP